MGDQVRGPGCQDRSKQDRLAVAGYCPRTYTPSYSKPVQTETTSVAATDGSQIFPARSEATSCHLINIGYVLLHYASGEKPLLNSIPTLFHGEYGNREVVGIKRSLMEISELAALSLAAQQEGHRVMAISDGTLIPFALEGRSQDFRDRNLAQLLEAFEQMRVAGIPLCGYISRPASRDLLHALSWDSVRSRTQTATPVRGCRQTHWLRTATFLAVRLMA